MDSSMKKNCFLIVTGGRLDSSFVEEFLNTHDVQTIICVDGALALCDRMELPIDYLVGDYDTVSPELITEYRNRAQSGEIETRILSFDPEKDQTDTQIAILLALELGAGEVYLLGATGSRMDHALANISLLRVFLERGVDAYIMDENNRIYLKDRPFQINEKQVYGDYFSLIPFGGTVKSVTLTGFKYNTDRIDFLLGDSLGVSNELILEEGNIDFETGTFIVIEAKD